MVTIKVDEVLPVKNSGITIKCIICGEFVALDRWEETCAVAKVCEKCKKAVMKVREIENG